MEFAQQEFKLSQRVGNSTQREELEAIYRKTKRKPEALENLIELPDCMKEYWQWFLRLNRKRPVGMGVSEISYTEMKSFFELHAISPEPYEIEILEMFDRLAVDHFNKEQQRESKSKSKSKK